MINYLETKICDVPDAGYQSMVATLIECVGFHPDDFTNQRLSFLLTEIGRGRKALTRARLAVDGILTKKVDKLSPDSVVYHVCLQLAKLNGTSIEAYDGKTVLSLIKNCHKIYCPPPPRAIKPTRRERSHQFTTDLIKQRRKNGVYS